MIHTSCKRLAWSGPGLLLALSAACSGPTGTLDMERPPELPLVAPTLTGISPALGPTSGGTAMTLT